jgi:survival of motor neuron protein-interacting protein 1
MWSQSERLSTEFPPSHAEHLPDRIWERKLLADFSDLRQALAASRVPEASSAAQHRDKAAWRRMCFGSATADAADSDTAAAAAAVPDTGLGEPQLSVVLGMDGAQAARLLQWYAGWLGTGVLTAARGRWLFALLARIEKPLPVGAHMRRARSSVERGS